MRISDWSSDVCSSDLVRFPEAEDLWTGALHPLDPRSGLTAWRRAGNARPGSSRNSRHRGRQSLTDTGGSQLELRMTRKSRPQRFARHREMRQRAGRSEEHTSELQSLMRISYAVFCLKKKKKQHSTYS